MSQYISKVLLSLSSHSTQTNIFYKDITDIITEYVYEFNRIIFSYSYGNAHCNYWSESLKCFVSNYENLHRMKGHLYLVRDTRETKDINVVKKYYILYGFAEITYPYNYYNKLDCIITTPITKRIACYLFIFYNSMSETMFDSNSANQLEHNEDKNKRIRFKAILNVFTIPRQLLFDNYLFNLFSADKEWFENISKNELIQKTKFEHEYLFLCDYCESQLNESCQTCINTIYYLIYRHDIPHEINIIIAKYLHRDYLVYNHFGLSETISNI